MIKTKGPLYLISNEIVCHVKPVCIYHGLVAVYLSKLPLPIEPLDTQYLSVHIPSDYTQFAAAGTICIFTEEEREKKKPSECSPKRKEETSRPAQAATTSSNNTHSY